jgi:hypothetical protein
LLSRNEQRLGSPEKPLSDLGLLSYRMYWRTSVIQALLHLDSNTTTINDLSLYTSMTHEDIIHTLRLMNAMHKNPNGDLVLCVDFKELKIYEQKIRKKGYLTIKQDNLKWDPILLHRMIAETESGGEGNSV